MSRVAVLAVARALREEAESMTRSSLDEDVQLIAGALLGVAERLEAPPSPLGSRTPTSDRPAPAVSASGADPARVDESHPGPRVVVTNPSVKATLLELKHVLGGRLHNDARARQLLDDAIELSSE